MILYIGDSGASRRPIEPAPEDMLMIRGLADFRSKGMSALERSHGPVAFTSKAVWMRSRSVAPVGIATAALFTRTSNFPWSFVIVETA